MSRAPPFPNRRARSPSSSNPNGSPSSSNGTRPLQIARPPSRPTTPSNSGLISGSPRGPPPNTAPSGPSRPQRSELRSRGSDYSASTSSYRDSTATDVSTSYRSRPSASSNPATPSNARPKPQRLRSAPTDDEQTTPAALTSVMSAFQSAGSRRRGMSVESEEVDYQRQRREEIEAEKQRQQRIRDKAPGRRVNGKARVGDIDGRSFSGCPCQLN
jgi:exocyst complex component 4